MGNNSGKLGGKLSMIEHTCSLPPEKVEVFPPPLKHPTFLKRTARCCIEARTLYPDHPQAEEIFKTRPEVLAERKRHCKMYPRIIHPLSKFRSRYELWRCFSLAAAMLYLSTFTTFLAGMPDREFVTPSFRFDFFIADWINFTLIVDLIMTFFSGYISEETIILDPKQIARHYICGIFFITDFIACFPLFWTKVLSSWLVFILSQSSLLKIIRMGTLLDSIRITGQYYKISTKLTEFLRFIVRVFLFVHWAACVMYVIPQYRLQLIGALHPGSWVNFEVRGLLDKEVWRQYVASLYKATALILTIKGDSTSYARRKDENRIPEEEYLADMVLAIVGKVYIYSITVLLLEAILGIRKLQTQYNETMNQVTGYMRQKKIPVEMQGRMTQYYDYKYDRKFFKESKINELFTDNMRTLINLHACRNFVKNVKLFKGIPEDMMRNILNYLEPEVFLPNDIILKANTDGDCMYFLSTGTVAVYTGTGTEICHLQDGAYFGEISLIATHTKRTATVIALEICQLYRLDRKSFRACIRKDSTVFKDLEEVAKARLKDTEDLMRRVVVPPFEVMG